MGLCFALRRIASRLTVGLYGRGSGLSLSKMQNMKSPAGAGPVSKLVLNDEPVFIPVVFNRWPEVGPRLHALNLALAAAVLIIAARAKLYKRGVVDSRADDNRMSVILRGVGDAVAEVARVYRAKHLGPLPVPLPRTQFGFTSEDAVYPAIENFNVL